MRKSLRLIVLVVFAACAGVGAGVAQTTLTAGDIAIIGFNYDDGDQVVFVPLVDLSNGTEIKFTDNAWDGSALKTNEGTHTYTAAGTVTKGTVVTLTTSGMSLSTSGDNILAYQGTSGSPTFIFGLCTLTWITVGVPSTNNSYLPASLTNGTNAVCFSPEKDNGNYSTVSNNSNKAELLSYICNTANWTLTDNRISPFPSWTFTVGSYATQPTAQPTSLSFTNVKSWKMDVAWTAASPAPAGYLVIKKDGSAPTGVPADGSGYAVGDAIGDGQVMYASTSVSFTQKSIIANTGYYYKVYSYNGSGATSNYLQASPLSGNQTSDDNNIGSYYSSVDPEDVDFVTDLETAIRSPYTKVTYDNYDETMVADFAFTYAAAGQRTTTCVYSGYEHTYTTFQWYSSSPMSREHTWCHSWMPTYSSTSGNEYADQHHLFPVHQASANGVRSNHPLGVVTSITSQFLDGKYGTDAGGNTVYEPRNAQKGDAARALLYMTVRYDGIGSEDWSFDYLNNTTLPALSEDPQDLALLLTWHGSDPPGNFDMARNDYVQSTQQNRNPFIDHPEYTDYIDFSDLSYIPPPAPNAIAAPTVVDFSLEVYPVPVTDLTEVSILSPAVYAGNLEILDALGRVVFTQAWNVVKGENHVIVDMGTYSPGVYLVRFMAGEHQDLVRVIKNP